MPLNHLISPRGKYRIAAHKRKFTTAYGEPARKIISRGMNAQFVKLNASSANCILLLEIPRRDAARYNRVK